MSLVFILPCVDGRYKMSDVTGPGFLKVAKLASNQSRSLQRAVSISQRVWLGGEVGNRRREGDVLWNMCKIDMEAKNLPLKGGEAGHRTR